LTPSASPLEVVCPICGAYYGRKCIGRNGKTRGPHPPRKALAQRLALSYASGAGRLRAQAAVTVRQPDGTTQTRTDLPTKTRAKSRGKIDASVRRHIAQQDLRIAARDAQTALKAQFLARQQARGDTARGPASATDSGD
jgi:hypothetical protein